MTSTPTDATPRAVNPPLSLLRLNVMRVGYAILGIGLAIVKWPLLWQRDQWELMEGVVTCMLIALSLLALLGLRYPRQLLPVLLFESAWKLIWLSAVALPQWTGDRMDPATREVTVDCLLVVIILAVIPWPYVFAHYLKKPGDPWRRPASA